MSSHLVLCPLGQRPCPPVCAQFACELLVSRGLQPVGRGHVGQGLGAAHHGLVTELGAWGVTTDHRGPGVTRQRQRHRATAAGGAQYSPPG